MKRGMGGRAKRNKTLNQKNMNKDIKKYAIVNKETKEFYPDPVYTDIQKAQEKVAWINAYSEKDLFEIEELTPEREAQHKKELMRFWSYID